MTPGATAGAIRQAVGITPEEHKAHVAQRPGLVGFLRDSSPVSILVLPLIYSAVLPFVLLDAWTTAYQWLCFPMFDIPRVSRRDYFVMDHQRLGYLNAIEKVHCTYCAYANGLIAYVREIAARTEQYWCPIKHGQPIIAPHDRYHLFVEYGDAAGYRHGLQGLRRSLTHECEP